jgi:uncharacterized membrane protein
MTKETLVFVLGIVLTLVPFLGIPEIYKQYLIVGAGVIFILIGYTLRRSLYFTKIDQGNGERGDDSFMETTKPLFGNKEVQ